jgi:hypothetical protein
MNYKVIKSMNQLNEESDITLNDIYYEWGSATYQPYY